MFKLSPNADGTWSKTVLYGFSGTQFGANSAFGVIPDNAGHLYGVTEKGGKGCNCGVVFEITR